METENLRTEIHKLIEEKVADELLTELKTRIILLVIEKSQTAYQASHIRKETLYYKFLTLLNQNYDKFYCISEYSHLLGISARKLNSLVALNSSLTSCQIIAGKIIEESKKKLIDTDLSIKEIAFLSGFSDPYYFSKFFKKYTGVSPRLFRKSAAGFYK
jgi:AraC-like DNA-binding protein